MSGAMTSVNALQIKKNGDTGTVTLTRTSDGAIEFTGPNGMRVRAHSNEELKKLYAVLQANT